MYLCTYVRHRQDSTIKSTLMAFFSHSAWHVWVASSLVYREETEEDDYSLTRIPFP